MACDMYGDGVAGDRDRVTRCLKALRDDPSMMVRRARAGLAALAGCPGTDGRVAAIGFCFGGMAALALARSGEPIAGCAITKSSTERSTTSIGNRWKDVAAFVALKRLYRRRALASDLTSWPGSRREGS
jgi:dienelactone hydrolase